MQIVIAKDPFDPETWSKHETENVRDFLCEQFDRFPDNARIYNGSVAEVNDVTPQSGSDGAELETLDGPLFVVLYPGDPASWTLATWLLIGTAAVSIASTAFMLLSMPNTASTNQQTSSANNTLSDRQNKARPKSRIPDIYGTVRSTPDLLQVPYRIFDADSNELEVSYMCVTRGAIDVIASNVFDGETNVSNIVGETVEVYGPNTSPNSGDTPQLRIGDAINKRILNVYKSNSVNGQTLYAPNYETLNATSNGAYFRANTHLYSIAGPNFKKYFSAGDTLYISMDPYPDGSGTIDLSGAYLIDSVDSVHVLLDSPESINSDWNKLTDFSSDRISFETFASYNLLVTTYYDTSTASPSSFVIGPYVVGDSTTTSIVLNFVASNGLYKAGSGGNDACPITVRVSTQHVDAYGTAYGTITTHDFVIPSSATDTSQKALTATIAFSGTCSVSVFRITPSDYTYDGSLVDEIKWRDLYAMSDVSASHFGNITTIQTLTKVTPSALGVKDRKLNLICTRKVPARIGSTSTFGALTATNSAADIICAIALDPKIGNRNISEIDVSNIYDTVAAIVSYFGISEAAEFCYTFDDNTTTFEETVTTIANTIFCQAYRQGSVTKLFFEQENADSSILFNHRNKIPNSETRNVRFGTEDDCDGIELTYIDPDDETEATFYVPTDQSAVKPKTVKSVGIRNAKQAHLQAWRAYNKLLYQNTAIEFTATQEAALVTRMNRVLIADNTRSDTQDGEVMAQDVLTLTLSQPFEYTETLSHNIFLQLYDGTTQSIAIASRDAANHRLVTLATAPTLPLCLDDDLYARTTYVIVGNSDARSLAFLIDTKDPQDMSKSQITAINYDARYYANDKDFV